MFQCKKYKRAISVFNSTRAVGTLASTFASIGFINANSACIVTYSTCAIVISVF